jgi:hypothetical protein
VHGQVERNQAFGIAIDRYFKTGLQEGTQMGLNLAHGDNVA